MDKSISLIAGIKVAGNGTNVLYKGSNLDYDAV
jgi:hypothetical protein